MTLLVLFCAVKNKMNCTTFLWSIAFVTLNITLNLYIKWLFHYKKFTFPITIVCVQQICSAFILFGWLIYKKQPLVVAKKSFVFICILSFLFVSNTLLNNMSLVSLSLTLNQCVRAFLPCALLAVATCIEKKRYPKQLVILAFLLTFSIFLTVYKNPSFELVGFIFATVSVFLAASFDSLSGKLLGNDMQGKIVQLTQLQSSVAFVFSVVPAGVIEFNAVRNYTQSNTLSETAFYLIIAGVLSTSYNLIRFELLNCTDSLFIPMIGNFKISIIVIISVFFFQDNLTTVNMIGVVLTFFIFSAYTFVFHKTKRANLKYEKISALHVKTAAVVANGGEEQIDNPADVSIEFAEEQKPQKELDDDKTPLI